MIGRVTSTSSGCRPLPRDAGCRRAPPAWNCSTNQARTRAIEITPSSRVAAASVAVSPSSSAIAAARCEGLLGGLVVRLMGRRRERLAQRRAHAAPGRARGRQRAPSAGRRRRPNAAPNVLREQRGAVRLIVEPQRRCPPEQDLALEGGIVGGIRESGELGEALRADPRTGAVRCRRRRAAGAAPPDPPVPTRRRARPRSSGGPRPRRCS